jgi:hypothetical protein
MDHPHGSGPAYGTSGSHRFRKRNPGDTLPTQPLPTVVACLNRGGDGHEHDDDRAEHLDLRELPGRDIGGAQALPRLRHVPLLSRPRTPHRTAGGVPRRRVTAATRGPDVP